MHKFATMAAAHFAGSPRRQSTMSVAAVLLGYGSTLLLAGAFGVESSSDKMPSTTAMAAVALATGALAMTGPVPPKKGEPGFARRVQATKQGRQGSP